MRDGKGTRSGLCAFDDDDDDVPRRRGPRGEHDLMMRVYYLIGRGVVVSHKTNSGMLRSCALCREMYGTIVNRRWILLARRFVSYYERNRRADLSLSLRRITLLPLDG